MFLSLMICCMSKRTQPRPCSTMGQGREDPGMRTPEISTDLTRELQLKLVSFKISAVHRYQQELKHSGLT